jgi:hypothetical protein
MVNGQSTRNTNRSQVSFSSLNKTTHEPKKSSAGPRVKPLPGHLPPSEHRIVSARSSKFSQRSTKKQHAGASGGNAHKFSRQPNNLSTSNNKKAQSGLLYQRYNNANERQGAQKQHLFEESPINGQNHEAVTQLKQQEISDRIYQNI